MDELGAALLADIGSYMAECDRKGTWAQPSDRATFVLLHDALHRFLEMFAAWDAEPPELRLVQ